jgi:hypothetical protein
MHTHVSFNKFKDGLLGRTHERSLNDNANVRNSLNKIYIPGGVYENVLIGGGFCRNEWIRA